MKFCRATRGNIVSYSRVYEYNLCKQEIVWLIHLLFVMFVRNLQMVQYDERENDISVMIYLKGWLGAIVDNVPLVWAIEVDLIYKDGSLGPFSPYYSFQR